MKIITAFFVFVIVVIAFVSSSSSVSASEQKKILGVMNELQEQYTNAVNTAENTFTCLDGSKTIKLSRVNDQHCDCADGSDEPGSSACTFVSSSVRNSAASNSYRFQCTNEGFGHLKQQFFHSRVNDGICDCCDGSDEYLYPSVTKCPNVCAEYSAKVQEEEKKREANRQAGLKARELLLSKAKQQREDWSSELKTVESTIDNLKKELEAAEAEVTKHEEAEREKRQEIHKESLAKKVVWEAEQAEIKKKKEEEAAAASAAVNTETPSSEKEETEIPPAAEGTGNMDPSIEQEVASMPSSENIECISWRQTKDCSGSGEREPHGDRSCNQVIEGGASGFCECKADGNDETYPYDCGHKKLKCDKVCLLRGGDDAFEEDDTPAAAAAPPVEKEPEFHVDDGSGYQHPEAQDARRKRDEARVKVQSAEQTVKDLKENLEKEYGADNIFLGLANDCFEKQAGEFTYKICPMKEAWQGHTSLGKFKSFGTQTYGSWGGKSDYTKQLYDGGTHCWGGPARNCEVILICGPENIITSVEEPSMCSYKMVFQTPAICE